MTSQGKDESTQPRSRHVKIRVVLGSKKTSDLQIRRFCQSQLLQGGSNRSLETLIHQLVQVTGIPQEELPKTFYYRTNDGAVASISTSQELSDALAFHHGKGKLEESLKLFSVIKNRRRAKGENKKCLRKARQIGDPLVVPQIRNKMGQNAVNDLDSDSKVVFKNLTESFQNHLTMTSSPKYNEKPVSEDRVDYHFNYTIGGRQIESRFFAINGLYLDMRAQRKIDGCVEVLLPYNRLPIFMEGPYSFKRTSRAEHDTLTQLVDIYVHVDQRNPPTLKSFHLSSNIAGRATAKARNDGFLIHLISSSNEHKHVYKILGVFTYSKIRSSNGSEWNPKFSLLALRVLSRHENLYFLTSNTATRTLFEKAVQPPSVDDSASGFTGFGSSVSSGVWRGTKMVHSFYPSSSSGEYPAFSIGTYSGESQRRRRRRVAPTHPPFNRSFTDKGHRDNFDDCMPHDQLKQLDDRTMQLKAVASRLSRRQGAIRQLRFGVIPILGQKGSEAPNTSIDAVANHQLEENSAADEHISEESLGLDALVTVDSDLQKLIEECSELVKEMQQSLGKAGFAEESSDDDVLMPQPTAAEKLAFTSSTKILRTFEVPKVPFRSRVGVDGNSMVEFQTITAMSEYQHLSAEELRYKDYGTGTIWVPCTSSISSVLSTSIK